MLLAEAFTDLLLYLDHCPSHCIIDGDLKARVAISLFQACFRSMIQQKENGSWDDSVEQTSYGVLILSEAWRLPYFESVQEHIQDAIRSATQYIQGKEGNAALPERLWVGKVSYSPEFVVRAYRLAALRASASLANSPTTEAFEITTEPYVKLFQQTPLFSCVPQWQIRCSSIESTLFQPLLRARRSLIFPRANMAEDKYFDIIPEILQKLLSLRLSTRSY